MIRAVRPQLAATCGLLACLGVLEHTREHVDTPPTDATLLLDWWTATDPGLAVGGLLNIGATLACAYLLAVTLVDLVASAARLRPLSEVARRLSPAVWRTLVLRPVTAGALAVPTLVAPLLSTTPAAVAESVDAVGSVDMAEGAEPLKLTLTWLGREDGAVSTASTTTTTTRPPAELSLEVGDRGDSSASNGPPSSGGESPESSASDAAPVESSTAHPERTAGLANHAVAPGESLWSIAEDHLTRSSGTSPSDAEVASYWRSVIAANRDRLPVPSNPDLIFPGSRIVLPAAP